MSTVYLKGEESHLIEGVRAGVADNSIKNEFSITKTL